MNVLWVNVQATTYPASPVEARDHELFEAAWMEHRDELTVGVPECVAKVTFQHGWVAGVSSRKRPRIK